MEKRRMEGGRAKHIRETGEEEIAWMKESMKEGRCESGEVKEGREEGRVRTGGYVDDALVDHVLLVLREADKAGGDAPHHNGPADAKQAPFFNLSLSLSLPVSPALRGRKRTTTATDAKKQRDSHVDPVDKGALVCE